MYNFTAYIFIILHTIIVGVVLTNNLTFNLFDFYKYSTAPYQTTTYVYALLYFTTYILFYLNFRTGCFRSSFQVVVVVFCSGDII